MEVDRIYKISKQIPCNHYLEKDSLVRILAFTPSKIFFKQVPNNGNIVYYNETITVNNSNEIRNSLTLIKYYDSKLYKVVNNSNKGLSNG